LLAQGEREASFSDSDPDPESSTKQKVNKQEFVRSKDAVKFRAID